MAATEAGWQSAWRALGIAYTPSLQALYQRLLAAYSEPHRHYHTRQHLRECFERLDEIRLHAAHLPEVEIALWFHDAVYDTRKSDNEQRSADWARQASLDAGVAPDVAGRIHSLVMVTRHAAAPQTMDEQVLVDVDLAILGAGTARFDEYERQVRAEYRWVPGFLYRRGRRKILREFLARGRIYSTAPLVASLEAPAQANLARSLAALG
jgi:predicted metal-dependent HD superfamily phosphohydrolase